MKIANSTKDVVGLFRLYLHQKTLYRNAPNIPYALQSNSHYHIYLFLLEILHNPLAAWRWCGIFYIANNNTNGRYMPLTKITLQTQESNGFSSLVHTL